MKIFSNFNTKLDKELYNAAKERFGDNRVVFVRRDKVYLFLKVWIPLAAWFITSLTILLILYINFSGRGFMQYLAGFTWLLVIISGIYILYRAIIKLIDFHMDYTIITPLSVVQYDQSGILGRSTRSLDISKIRSISIDKQGLFKSFFNYGSIVFFSEGDSSFGDITLNYISDPINLRNSIEHIIVLHTSLKEEVIDSEGTKKIQSLTDSDDQEKIESLTPET